MAKKLTLVVPHYKEPFEILKYLLDTIECQKGIDRNDFDVCIVNDGDEVILDEELFKQYHYDIKYVIKPHGGLSDVRNYGIEHGDSEYLMYCDSDDGFLNNYGLHLVLGAIQEGFDLLYSTFVEEQPMGDGWKIYRREKDMVFCHGKVYRRQFLLDKKLRFDTSLSFSEDSLFNKIASVEAESLKEINTPFYLWCWNEGSTVRADRETIVLRRYAEVVDMRYKIAEQLYERGFIDEFFDSVCKSFFDCYYDFSEPAFMDPGNKPMVLKAEKEFKRYYKRFIKDFLECDSKRIGRIMMSCRTTSYQSGMVMEKMDFHSWLKHIKNDVKI